MAVDSRPVMTTPFFEEAALYQDKNWWFTGEGLIHRDAVMQIEGWSEYGSKGFNQLTEAQQVLMIWSDLVGQVSNGGFEQFASNYSQVMPLARASIPKLGWTELSDRFNSAADDADAFDNWFYQNSTKEQSLEYVGAYVRRNRDQLCRIQD